jgi:hypothetical protein
MNDVQLVALLLESEVSGRLCVASRGAHYASSEASPAGRLLHGSIHPSFAEIEGALANTCPGDTSNDDEEEGGA